MSVNRPLQRIGRQVAAAPAFAHSARPQALFPGPSYISRRTLFGFLKRNREESAAPLDPLSERFRQKKQKDNAISRNAAQARGGIAPGSIFDEGDEALTGDKDSTSGSARTRDTSVKNRDPALMVGVLDPQPEARRAWERKMIIREIRRRGRINKATLLARVERQHLAKSKFIKGSIKKLMPLARQIAGKPIDEALIQMRFSKKKAAKEIMAHLERARDEAVVARGMGLGSAAESGEKTPRMVVQDKKGTRRVVANETSIYVDQAWVGRGTPDYGVDYRARGRTHRLTKSFTSISVLLKEEKTRIRQMNERADKEAAKMPWLHLPDRPVTRQTQYPLW